MSAIGGDIYSKPAQFDWVDGCFDMVAFLLNLGIFLAKWVRLGLFWISLPQRLPFLLWGFFSLVLIRLPWGLGWHRFWVKQFRLCVRLALFLRGIRVTVKTDSGQPLSAMRGCHVVNQTDPLSLWVLMSVLPLHHLMVVNDSFFSLKWARPWLFLLGFVPQEHGIQPESIPTFESRLLPYLKDGYGIIQPVFFEYRDMHELPYVVILALMVESPIMIWQLKKANQLDRVHFLNRRHVELVFLTSIPISKRLPVTIAMYEKAIHQHFSVPIGQPESRNQPGAKSPDLPHEIAKKKFDDLKKSNLESEIESRFQ